MLDRRTFLLSPLLAPALRVPEPSYVFDWSVPYTDHPVYKERFEGPGMYPPRFRVYFRGLLWDDRHRVINRVKTGPDGCVTFTLFRWGCPVGEVVDPDGRVWQTDEPGCPDWFAGGVEVRLKRVTVYGHVGFSWDERPATDKA